jgi:hypothetical protein
LNLEILRKPRGNDIHSSLRLRGNAGFQPTHYS